MFEEDAERTQQCVEQQLQPAESAAPDIEPTHSAVHQLTPVTPPRWGFSTTPVETACSHWGMNESISRSGPPQDPDCDLSPLSTSPTTQHKGTVFQSCHYSTATRWKCSCGWYYIWHEGISLMSHKVWLRTEIVRSERISEVKLRPKWLRQDSAPHVRRMKTAQVSHPEVGSKKVWDCLKECFGSPEII